MNPVCTGPEKDQYGEDGPSRKNSQPPGQPQCLLQPQVAEAAGCDSREAEGIFLVALHSTERAMGLRSHRARDDGSVSGREPEDWTFLE